MSKYKNTVLIFFISALSLHMLFSAHAQAEAQTQNWIASHKNASSEEIDNFVTKELVKIQNITKGYAALDALLEAYPESRIPVSIYTMYARLAELSFDFEAALKMYLHAYERTDNEQYLIRASVHALEVGNAHDAFSYLTQIENRKITDLQRIFLNVMQAKALMQDGQPDMALALLQTLPFIVGQKNLTSSFYYTLYDIAKKNNKPVQANLAHQILTEQFPYSIEVYMLNSPRVQPLPLPSRLFNVNAEILGGIEGMNKPMAETNSENNQVVKSAPVPVETQSAPKVGYQVAAFTELANAQNAFEHYFSLWRSLNFDGIQTPVLTQRDVSGLRFYQIIFPFEEALEEDTEEQHKIVKKLREHNIEGGFLINQ